MWVYLPKDYTASTKKYPVIYMHDGQNLFRQNRETLSGWTIDEALNDINAQVIVIGIESDTNQQYGKNKTDEYLAFIVEMLKPKIDATYRTKTNAHNTCIMGSSLGGAVSFYAALKYPEVFGKVGCFFPAFGFNRAELLVLLAKTETFKAKVYFLCGDRENNPEMLSDITLVEHWVNTKRCECKKLNKKVIVKGGQQDEELWRESFKKAYLWLF
ncbi:alpha/beta hydrolase [Flavobacterium silvisoli]|uniref:alpha/beta hydrolase n=1 Tax=Flavobacterium silvisoli TaxID=2529433 RepID=UPI001F01BA97|nr:alpha/beta hydrolase-fold protein [Flavobacterium silvisoli]